MIKSCRIVNFPLPNQLQPNVASPKSRRQFEFQLLDYFVASALFFVSAATAQTPAAAGKVDDDQVRQTVAAFWKAFGDFDGSAFKATLDWPNLIVQSRPDKGTRAATANTDVAVFDAEMRRTWTNSPNKEK
jgi:hypothetical protein